MRIRILCAAVLAVAHAATAGAQAVPAPLPTGDGWVALTIADYLKLREQANPRPTPPSPPPARATVSETAYELTAGEGLATGTAELAIDVLDDGWIEVPLPASLFVRAARLGGRPLAIADGARHGRRIGGLRRSRRILLSRKGRSLVTLDVAVPIAETAGNEYIQLPPATGGLVRATLTVPRADVAIVASGGAIVERAADAGAHRVTAHAALGQSARAVVVAQARHGQCARCRPVCAVSSSTSSASARRRPWSPRASPSTCCGAAPRRSRCGVPAGLVVNQVQGAHVADWDVQGAALTITLLDRVDRQTAVVVSGEFRPPAVGPDRGAAAAPRRRGARDRRGRGRGARRRRGDEARGARPRSDRSGRPRRSVDAAACRRPSSPSAIAAIARTPSARWR